LHVSVFDLNPDGQARTKKISALKRLQHKFREAKVEALKRPEEAKNYYKELRFRISGTDGRGNDIELADGGDTDWTQKLLGNAKERLVISGIGTERLCESFGPNFLKKRRRTG
jgi:hypothetical protein